MLQIATIDAFTDQPFKGNPAGVCITDTPLPVEMMQNIAAELNLSETAFVVPIGEAKWSLRWFTPAVEIELCGHATLASAHRLFEQRLVASDTLLRFQTLSGELTARKVGDKIELDFPAIVVAPFEPQAEVIKALGIAPIHSRRKGLFTLFEFESNQVVRELAPDLKSMVEQGFGKFVVTARSENPKYDLVSRFFAPGAGIDEDPVTGSAHCVLAPFWAEKLSKNILHCYQASKRGGELEVELRGDRVLMRGHAVTVMKGDLLV